MINDYLSIHKQATLNYGGKSYGLAEIEQMINVVCRCLSCNKKHAPVAVSMEYSVWLIPVLFACLRMGIPYVLLDSRLPLLRIQTILNDCQAWEMVVCDSEIVLPIGYSPLCLRDKKTEEHYNEAGMIPVSNIAYIMYTSGTTGKPKGVEVCKESVINFIHGIMERLHFCPQQRIACITRPSFDIFFLESILALCVGLAVYLPEEETASNARKLTRWLQQERIEILQITPSRLQQIMIIDDQLKSLQYLKFLLLGGEQLPDKVLAHAQKFIRARIFNMYGPTETTIWSSVADLTYSKRVTIGQPIKQTHFYILSDDLSTVPKGEIGEICIAGSGLAKGYLHDPVETQRAFTFLDNGTRIYRTGDLGSEIASQTFVCYGRKDRQIKLRGHRIELREIECGIEQYSGVITAVCVFDADKSTILAGYTSVIPIEADKIRQFLVTVLPEYMIPAIIRPLSSIPLTERGKIDTQTISQILAEKPNC